MLPIRLLFSSRMIQEEALSLVDQVAVMLDGSVEQVASPHELYTNPANRAVAEFIGDANFLPGVGHGDTVECELGNSGCAASPFMVR